MSGCTFVRCGRFGHGFSKLALYFKLFKLGRSSYLFSSGSVWNINVYHSCSDKLAPVVGEAGEQVLLIVRQAVVHEQHSTETGIYY